MADHFPDGRGAVGQTYGILPDMQQHPVEHIPRFRLYLAKPAHLRLIMDDHFPSSVYALG